MPVKTSKRAFNYNRWYNGTMDQTQYKNVLKDHLLPEYEAAKNDGGDWKLMQDNAPSHKAKSIMDFLASKQVEMIAWPPYSPDLNPIENVWAWMKQQLADNFPVSTTREMLEESFMQIWDSITPEMCHAFSGSYEKRLKAVIDANGGHTKY